MHPTTTMLSPVQKQFPSDPCNHRASAEAFWPLCCSCVGFHIYWVFMLENIYPICTCWYLCTQLHMFQNTVNLCLMATFTSFGPNLTVSLWTISMKKTLCASNDLQSHFSLFLLLHVANLAWVAAQQTVIHTVCWDGTGPSMYLTLHKHYRSLLTMPLSLSTRGAQSKSGIPLKNGPPQYPLM